MTEGQKHADKNRKRGCVFALATPILLYAFVRVVPAKWYMPRYFDARVYECVSENTSIGLIFCHYQSYHDYSEGIWRVLNGGPVANHRCRDILSVFSADPNLNLTPVYGTISQDDSTIRGFYSLDNGVSFIKENDDGVAQIGQLSDQGVKYSNYEEGQNKSVWMCAGKMIIMRDKNDAVSIHMPGQKFASEEWRGVLDNFHVGDNYPKCRVPWTMAKMEVAYESNRRKSADIALYTFLPGDGVATNVYRSCYSNVLATTVLGTPEDALFVESVFEEVPGGTVMRPVSRRLKYVAWNRAGLIRWFDVPYGEKPEPQVALHTSTDGRKYIVTLWAMKARRRSVDFRFTFVDLASGEQIVRDVTVPVPTRQ